jgi:hypothetical protein
MLARLKVRCALQELAAALREHAGVATMIRIGHSQRYEPRVTVQCHGVGVRMYRMQAMHTNYSNFYEPSESVLLASPRRNLGPLI